jgi:hypothetical protein
MPRRVTVLLPATLSVLGSRWKWLLRSCSPAAGLPPDKDMVIEELSDEEAEAFWAAITQA